MDDLALLKEKNQGDQVNACLTVMVIIFHSGLCFSLRTLRLCAINCCFRIIQYEEGPSPLVFHVKQFL